MKRSPWSCRARRALAGLLPAAFALAAPLSSPALAAPPRVHAIVGARIVTAPGQVIERGTIVMRDGVITAVGASAAVPADARVWDGAGLTVYPGLIDAYVLPSEAPGLGGGAGRGPASPFMQPAAVSAPRGAAHELSSVHPETRVIESLPLGNDQLESLRAAGFAAARVAPRRGIVRGSSAVIGLGKGSANASAIRADQAQVIALEPDSVGYPGSLMGAIAVIRQALMDARWYRDAQASYAKSPSGKPRPEANDAWAALGPLVAGDQSALLVADDMLETMSAGAIAREAAIKAEIVGAGDEYKRVKEIAALGLPMVVPVNFPDAPDVSDPDRAVEVATEELRQWDQAPGNPAVLKRAGVAFALTANGLKDAKMFGARVATAIQRGLDAKDALAAVTTTPAQMLGLSDRLGTIAAGKIANLTVTRGDLFTRRGKVREVWVDGQRYEVAGESPFVGSWLISWGPHDMPLSVAIGRDTIVKLTVGSDTLRAFGVRVESGALSFTVRRGEEPAEFFYLTSKDDRLSGSLNVGEHSHTVSGRRAGPSDGPEGGPMGGRDRGKDEPIATPVVMGNTEAWRMPRPAQPALVLVRNATVWTAGRAGTLETTDLLVRGGKIAAVGKGLAAPANAVVVDASGKHVAPGIIDCHSHSAILGNVNECTNNVTAEVRIQDVINSENVNIYRQLASGGTMMHLLHGSCNAIGGQCAVIKNKWGEPPDQLLFAAAPQTIKFALGENPKRSNDTRPAPQPRYPQSRSGVEESIREAFATARDYRAAAAEWKAGKRPYPPRRDLQREAIAEILEGKRFIHSHSYRQDEILMLMRVAEEFGIHVQTFQHVLEGYKVADEMASHGAMASTFSDWWAYKFEVIDAIPYNGYLMWDRGVAVSYNSDSDELARRLNTEAAKAVKYGGVPREEAIQFVTLNPAKQLRIEDRVGSLEVGKDADFAIWSGSPLSPYSICEQTWIEGRKYFDRAEDLAGRASLAKEREQLITKARGAKRESGGPLASNWPPRYLDDADMSGNDCGAGEGAGEAFNSEAKRRGAREEARP